MYNILYRRFSLITVGKTIQLIKKSCFSIPKLTKYNKHTIIQSFNDLKLDR